jgi:hypothetical protein
MLADGCSRLFSGGRRNKAGIMPTTVRITVNANTRSNAVERLAGTAIQLCDDAGWSASDRRSCAAGPDRTWVGGFFRWGRV